jgi:hypothetical protein
MKVQVLLMDSGYSSITDVAAKLEIIPNASIRMVLLNKEGQWLLHTLLIDILPDELQGSASSYNYNYDVVAFVARTVQGTSRPYGINPEKLEFFVRRGASTFPAKLEEIVALAQNSI